MAVAPILGLRKAIVTHLRADVGVTGTAVGARIYGERAPASPTWPFVRYGVSDASGDTISVPLHVFSKDDFTDDVNAIAEAIGLSLDEKTLVLGDGRKAYIAWVGMNGGMPDGEEQSAWHTVVTVQARIPHGC